MYPDAIVGHSVGEVAASVVADALNFAQGICLIYCHGLDLESIAGKGCMVAVGISEESAKDLISLYEGQLDIAAVNGVESTVISGSVAEVDEIAQNVQKSGRFGS